MGSPEGRAKMAGALREATGCNWSNMKSVGYRELSRVRPLPKSPPEAVKITYYNATFRASFWARTRVHGVLVEEPGAFSQPELSVARRHIRGALRGSRPADSVQPPFPSASQVLRGVDALSRPTTSFSTLTDDRGRATIVLRGLQHNANYTMFLAGVSPETFPPHVLSADQDVSATHFTTLFNPSLGNYGSLMLDQLQHYNQPLYDAIR